MATDLIYDIEVSKDKNSIKLKVEIPARVKAKDPIIEFGDKNAVDVLRDAGMLEGYELEKTNIRLSNWYENNRTNTWVFTKEGIVKAKPKATATITETTPTATVSTTETTTAAAPKKVSSRAQTRRSKRARTKVTASETTTKSTD